MEGDFFDAEAATWDEDAGHRERNERIAEAIRGALSLDPAMTALDIGGGTGMLSFLLADAVARVTITDASAGMIDVAGQRIAAAGLGDRVEAVRLDLTGPDFEAWLAGREGAYDVAWSAMAFHHVPDVDLLIAHLGELLAPGAQLAVADLDRDPEGHFHENRAGFDGHHGFDRDLLASKLVASGFLDVTFRTVMTLEKDGRDFPVFLLTARNHRS